MSKSVPKAPPESVALYEALLVTIPRSSARAQHACSLRPKPTTKKKPAKNGASARRK